MMTRQYRTTLLHRLWMPVLAALCLGYFGLSAYGGAYGLRSMETLSETRAELQLRLRFLREQREDLEGRIAEVRPESLDTEVVDVLARRALNVIRDDEIVIRVGAMQ